MSLVGVAKLGSDELRVWPLETKLIGRALSGSDIILLSAILAVRYSTDLYCELAEQVLPKHTTYKVS